MKVQGTDLSMIRGDSETITVSCADINDQPLPFQVGDIVYFTVKERAIDVEKILQKIVTVFETDGTAIVDIDPIDTTNLKFKTYIYDIQWVKEDGTVTTIVRPSKFTLLEEVTHE